MPVGVDELGVREHAEQHVALMAGGVAELAQHGLLDRGLGDQVERHERLGPVPRGEHLLHQLAEPLPRGCCSHSARSPVPKPRSGT